MHMLNAARALSTCKSLISALRYPAIAQHSYSSTTNTTVQSRGATDKEFMTFLGVDSMTIHSHIPQHRNFRCMLIDLDDTLYRVEEIAVQVRANIEKYLVEKLNVPSDAVEQATSELYYQYGTTMAGMVALGHKIDYDDFHKDVHHTLKYHSLLKRDAQLRQVLMSCKLPKYIFTNADIKHAEICLGILGIRDCFQDIIAFENLNSEGVRLGVIPNNRVLCKPDPKAFQLALSMVGYDAKDAIFCDDSIRNITSAHQSGLFTIMVGKDTPVPGADVVLPTMHELPEHLPELFEPSPSEVEVELEASMPIAVAAS